MPDEESKSCEPLPDGLTQVTQVEGLIPKREAYFRFVSIATSFIFRRVLALRTALQSHWPVIEIPSKASASQFFFHSFERYGKWVKLAWKVPRIAAMRVFSSKVSSVSSDRATTSDKLQNCFD